MGDYNNYHSENKKRLMGISFKNSMLSDAEKLSPDTYGADAFFIDSGFANDEMLYEFPLIAREYIKNVPEIMQEENNVHYTDTSFSSSNSYTAFVKKILTKMLYKAKNGDSYTIQFMKFLYQTYHKKEYNSLKRFNKISTTELCDIADGNCPYIPFHANVSRVLIMCTILGIELDEDASLIFLILNDNYERIKPEEDNNKIEEIEYEEFSNAVKEIEELSGTTDEHELYQKAKIYKEQMRFTRKALKHFGYESDYAEISNGESISLKHDLANSLLLLKKMHPGKQYTFEEIQQYAVNYNMIATICTISIDTESFIDLMLGYTENNTYLEPMLNDSIFRPEQFRPNIPSVKAETKPISAPIPIKNDYKPEDLLSEIENLRRKLHDKEYSLDHMTQLYIEAKNHIKTTESYKDKYDEAYAELVALREHVYHEGLEPSHDTDEKSLADIKSIIKNKRIAIIGGPDNWISKVKKEFPDWIYLNFQSSTTIPDRILDNCDYVYFFTGFLKHNVYYRFINIVRERHLPFGYINNSNISVVATLIYENLKNN